MASATIRITGPRGRFVQGDAFEPQTTDQQGAPLVIKTGPNAGQPTKRWFMAVAYRKDNPETLPYLKQLATFGATSWPAYFPAGANGPAPLFGCTHPRFSFKIMDGDGVDDNGKQNSAKEGFAGCWVVKYSTSIQAPGVWQEPNFDEMARVTDPRALPRGYYVRINHTVQSNENDQRPGLYVNLDKVAISADQNGAAVIQSGPTAAEAFGGSAPTSPPPPAALATPSAPGGLVAVPGAAHGIDALRAAGWTDDQIVTAGYATRAATPPMPPAPPAAPASPPPPAYTGYIPAVPASPPPHAAPAAPVHTMLPAAGGASYEVLIKAGWTDALLIQHGMMSP